MDEITNKKEFQKKINNGTVLIDFFTVWCGPCKTQSKILKENAQQLKSAIKELSMYKIDCDKLNDVADEYNIRAIPTLIFFRGGKPYFMESGVKRPEQIIEFARNNLSAN